MPGDVKRHPYTQRAIERAIKAALRSGLKVVAVRPDGTVLTDAAAAGVDDETSKWADRRPGEAVDGPENFDAAPRRKRRPLDARVKLGGQDGR